MLPSASLIGLLDFTIWADFWGFACATILRRVAAKSTFMDSTDAEFVHQLFRDNNELRSKVSSLTREVRLFRLTIALQQFSGNWKNGGWYKRLARNWRWRRRGRRRGYSVRGIRNLAFISRASPPGPLQHVKDRQVAPEQDYLLRLPVQIPPVL